MLEERIELEDFALLELVELEESRELELWVLLLDVVLELEVQAPSFCQEAGVKSGSSP